MRYKKIDLSKSDRRYMRHLLGVLGIGLLALILSSCEENVKSKSIEQIYKENGVPVRVEKVALQTLTKKFSATSTMTGIEEITEHAMVGGKIKAVHAKVGDKVKKGTLIVSFPNNNPTAKYFQAKEAYENARSSYERLTELNSAGGISNQDYDNVKTQYEVAKANFNVVSRMVFYRAPMAGVISKISVRATENVDDRHALFTISQMHKMKARIMVSDRDVTRFKAGQTAWAIWNDTKMKGKVVQVDMAINPRSMSYGVNLEFDNPEGIRTTGFTADIEVDLSVKQDVVVVDQKNILSDDEGQFVYVENSGAAKRKAIKTGLSSGNAVEVISGLAVGEMLITEGQLLLKDGKKTNLIDHK